MDITSSFDGGNIEVLGPAGPHTVRLAIRKDNNSDFFQWFYFRATGGQNVNCRIIIENASESAYPEGWHNYSVVASYDRQNWFRIPTDYDGKKLTINHRPETDVVWYAYFAPYSMERHGDLIATAATNPLVRLRSLGQTIDGQDIDMIELGSGGGPNGKKIWFIGRQHPGETMAEWWMEGLLDRLLDFDDPVARKLLAKARFYIIPNMNPDGSRRGHLRTNAAGVNLNRVWDNPSEETSPEVYWARRNMERLGVDFHMDVHGDEALPYNFVAGFEGIPSINEKQTQLFKRFKITLAALSPDFQTEHGYPKDAPGTADLKKCTDWVAERFGCPALTLEMPFKDNANAPEPTFGWSPDRCKHLARHCLMPCQQLSTTCKKACLL
ncbi:hypothetical protein JCM17844_17150 [Iodidimonas gelatinilytica]|uniref:Peptidase M14 domain-containing protein n=1 Tax=Iodidimonas gelatinilytica TaxID=1236966 RepID=A0A5A7MST9_9PROT|nr:M14-type cytosolic carboxypeptidase [Iodidimonas gelatinilytica]GEQ98078.1 hypothetical protein JCM17844_17150 [Iodidimonas gelatinilytica]